MGQPKYISAHHGAPFASKIRAAPWPPQAFTGWEKTCQVWKFGRIRDDTSILVISCFQINQSYGYFTGNVRLSENPKEIMMINHNFPYSLIARFVFFHHLFEAHPAMNSQVDPAIPASLVCSQFQLLETTFIGVTCSDVVNTTIKLPFGDIWECFLQAIDGDTKSSLLLGLSLRCHEQKCFKATSSLIHPWMNQLLWATIETQSANNHYCCCTWSPA